MTEGSWWELRDARRSMKTTQYSARRALPSPSRSLSESSPKAKMLLLRDASYCSGHLLLGYRIVEFRDRVPIFHGFGRAICGGRQANVVQVVECFAAVDALVSCLDRMRKKPPDRRTSGRTPTRTRRLGHGRSLG